MTTKSSQNWLPTYLALGTIWGLSFLFIAWANESLSPVGVAFWRLVFGAIPMALLAWRAKNHWPRDWRIWAKMCITSICMSSVPGVLFAFAELHSTSAFAGIMNGSTPIWTLVFILLFFRAEKPAPNVFVGLGIGLVGVLLVLQVWNGLGENDPWSVGALTLAVVLYGIGGPYTRRFISPLKIDSNVQVAMQVGIAAIMLAPFYFVPVLFGAPLLAAPLTFTAVLGMVLLGVLGTGIAYVGYYALMNSAGSAVANSVTYLSPVVAVLAGALVLGEHLTWNELVGGAIVILGAAVSQGYFKRKAA
ncbi:MAG: hypothetical protein RL670_738 [Actinomycetota bacterium]